MYCTSFDWPPSATIPWSSCSSKVRISCSVTSLAPIVCTMWKQFIETFLQESTAISIIGMGLVKRNCLHISYGSKYIRTYNVCTLEKGLNPLAICTYVCQGPGIHRSTNCVMQPTITSTYSLHFKKKFPYLMVVTQYFCKM